VAFDFATDVEKKAAGNIICRTLSRLLLLRLNKLYIIRIIIKGMVCN
jgi:hypothetical protein